MRVFIAGEKDRGKRADRFIQSVLPELPFGLLAKTFRKRDIKVNGSRVKENHILEAGDRVEVYLSDELLKPHLQNIELPSVYEDEHIIVINKPQGIPVQDEHEPDVEKIAQQLYGSLLEDGFPALCHRLDRNTGGLLLMAKHKEALEILFNKFRGREISKRYRCVVLGCPKKPYAKCEAYLIKDQKNSQVKIYSSRVPGSISIRTNYRVLETNGELTLLDVELLTGRTHQIRAHLAYLGHPVLGDGKYGINSVNRRYGLRWQLLWSTSIRFCFEKDAGILNYLNGKTISLPEKALSDILKTHRM